MKDELYKKTLWTIVKENLQENEDILVIRESEIDVRKGIMKKYTFDQIFNCLSGKERVTRYWHEDGLCIVLNI